MTIAKNEFFRFDNNYYKMSAVISIRSGFADCVFIVGNSFWCIHNRRIWPAPSSSPFPSGNRDTDISLFRALIPVILDKHASGRVVVAYNLFGPSERWYPGNPLAKSCSGIGGFLVYSSRPINGPTPARTYLKNFQLWPNKPGIVSPPSAGLWSLKLLKHKNDSLIEP